MRLRSEYDNLDNLVLAEDALKRQVRFKYDKKTRGLPTHIVQPDGSVNKVKYDDRRNVVEITDAHGVSNYFEYDSLNRIIETIDGNGNSTQYNYDTANNITRITNPEGNSQTYEYNKAKKLTKITDFNGATISFSYNNLNKLSEIVDQQGRVTQFGFDEMWNINHLKQPNGAESSFIYNKNNRLVKIEKPDGNTIKYEYDKNGNKTKIIDENGSETYLAYDELQRVTEVSTEKGIQFLYTYNSDGQITSVIDAMDNLTQFVYNEGGELIQEINALGNSRSYTYTALGKVQSVTDEVGRVTTYDYESSGRLKSILHPDDTSEMFTYDNNGNGKTYTNKLGLITTYVYDSLNRVIEIVNVNGESKRYTYDQVDNVLSMTNELGHTTNYSYTLTGQLEKVVDPLGNETHYNYDMLDQLIEVRQLGEVDGTDGVEVDLKQVNYLNEASRITTYKRDLLGQVTSVTDALGQSEHYTYSPIGQLIEKIDKDGFTTEYGYTFQGDVNYIKYDDGKEVFMEYNPLNQLTEVRDWLGTTSIEVNPFGQATKVTDHNDNIISYAYGNMGERRSLTYPDGKIINYHYDDALRLTQIQDGEQFTNYIYNQYSQLVEKQYPNNTTSKYSFNELGQMQSLIHSKSGKNYSGREFEDNFDQFHYEYDRLGNKVEVNRIRKGFESKYYGRYHYQYDELNRIKKVMQGQDTIRSYKYDGYGNRTRMIEKGNNTSYSYNSLNQLISKHDDLGNNFEYVYDRRGNMSEMYKNNDLIHKHHFGALNRLEATFNYEKNLGTNYSYNGLGNRVFKMQGTCLEPILATTGLENMKLSPTKQVDNVLDLTRGFNNLLQRSENGHLTSYTFDFSVLSAHRKDQTFHYFHDDLGSPIRLINDRGHEQDRFDYDEFGNSGSPDSNQVFGFVGYELDPISNTVLSPTRSYDPKNGRFTSQDTHWHTKNMIWGDIETYSEVPEQLQGLAPDPLAMGQANNLYGYTMNNPLRYTDPTGFCSEDDDNPTGFLNSIWDGIRQSFDGLVNINNFWDGISTLFNWVEMIGIGGRAAFLQYKIDSLALEIIPLGTPLDSPRKFRGDEYRRYLNNITDKDIRINQSKLKPLKSVIKYAPVGAGILNFINRLSNGDNVVEAAGMATVTTVGAVQGAKAGAKSGAWFGAKLGVVGGPKGAAIGGAVGGFVGGVAGAITGSGAVEGVINFFRRR